MPAWAPVGLLRFFSLALLAGAALAEPAGGLRLAQTRPAPAGGPEQGSWFGRARPGAAFETTFGPGSIDAAAALPDGGIVLAGRTFVLAGGGSEEVVDVHATVRRLDAAGRVLWTYAFETRPGSQPHAVQPRPGGRILVTGYAGSEPGIAERDREWIAELDQAGRVLHDKAFGAERRQIWRSVRPLGEGALGVVGSAVLTTGQAGAEGFGIDRDGKVLWTMRMPDAAGDCEAVATADPDGTLAVLIQAAETGSPPTNRLRRIDASGRVVLDRKLETVPDACAKALRPAPGGGYALAGLRDDASGRTGWAAALDRDGSLLWERDFGPADAKTLTIGFDVAPLGDGGVVVVGCIAPEKVEETKAFALRFGRTGEIGGERLFSGPDGLMARTVAATSKGVVALAGLRGRGCAEVSGQRLGGTAWASVVPLGEIAGPPR